VTRPTGSIRRARRISAGLFAVTVGLLSACGSDDGGSASDTTASSSSSAASSASATASESAAGSSEATAGGTLAVNSVDFSFEMDSTDLAAGDYTIELTNGGSATHNLRVEKDGEDIGGTDMVSPGDTGSATVTLEPGEYVFYCGVGNHRAMGMEVTVTVT
jgi:plastocyanin